jgi:hypothetical protein
MIKIQATTRLLADEADWFSKLSREEQKKYVEEHPHSKYAEDYNNACDAEPKDDNGDADRIKELKKQIGWLVDDVKELEADGEDASKEKNLLQRLRSELVELQG